MYSYKDYFGQEVAFGDDVAFTTKSYGNYVQLRKGKLIGFTDNGRARIIVDDKYLVVLHLNRFVKIYSQEEE